MHILAAYAWKGFKHRDVEVKRIETISLKSTEFNILVQWYVYIIKKYMYIETVCSKMFYIEEFTFKISEGNYIINNNFLKTWKGFIYQNSKEGKGSNLDS